MVAVDDMVTIDADFVRNQARQAVWKFFRPITLTFFSAYQPVRMNGPTYETIVPKASRPSIKGYALKKRP